jgi:hypothetical protein
MSSEEYDKLSPSEREAKDKEQRLREIAEQAGQPISLYGLKRPAFHSANQLCLIHGNKSLEISI